MKKAIFLLYILLFTPLAMRGQSPLSYHVEAGIGTSCFYGHLSKSDTRIAYKAGIGAMLQPSFGLQSGVEVVSIGGKRQILDVNSGNMNSVYLQVPLLAEARLHFSKDYHASLAAGPYMAFGIGGKTKGTMATESSSHSPEDYAFSIPTFGNLIDGKAGSKYFDWGLRIRLTLEYKRFIAGAEVQMGLRTVNTQLQYAINGLGGFNPKNLGTFFTLGYRIF